MAIDGSFFVKHIRPWGLDAIAQMTVQNGDVYQYLSAHLQMQPQQIEQLFAGWAQTAMLPVSAANTAAFVATASAIAIARWDQHGQTAASTVLFMPSQTIQALSQWSEQHRNQTSDVMLADAVPIAVTIFRNPDTAPQVDHDVDSLPGVVVRNGLCVHMDPLPAH